jgi:hypothetical protein
MEPALHQWANSLAATGVSNWLSTREWLIATSQSIHIVMLSVVFGSAVLINLRLLGVNSRGRPVSALVRTLVPWMYGALLVLLATGILQTVAEPLREFITPAFWAKMAMVVIAVLLTAALSRSVRLNRERWDHPASRPRTAALIALVSLALWIAIIFCGRFIGYTWENYA